MSTHNADAFGSVTVPAALTRRRAIARLLGAAGAGLAFAALPAGAQAAPASTTVDTPPSAWPAPSPLASAIIGRLLEDLHQFFVDAKAGVPLDEARARMEVRADAIYEELVAPGGPEARAAWGDALERIAYVLALFSTHFGMDAA